MMNMNIRNHGTVIGRLVRDPKFFSNQDGSRKAVFTLAANRNYKNKEGKRDSDFIPLEAFISSKVPQHSVYDLIHQGDLVAISYTIRSSMYTDQSGELQQRTYLLVQSVELLEQPSVTQKRASSRQESAATPENEDTEFFDTDGEDGDMPF